MVVLFLLFNDKINQHWEACNYKCASPEQYFYISLRCYLSGDIFPCIFGHWIKIELALHFFITDCVLWIYSNFLWKNMSCFLVIEQIGLCGKKKFWFILCIRCEDIVSYDPGTFFFTGSILFNVQVILIWPKSCASKTEISFNKCKFF